MGRKVQLAWASGSVAQSVKMLSRKQVASIIKKQDTLKRQCHKIFDPWSLSSINTPWGPDSRAKAISHMASNSPRNSRYLFVMVGFRGFNETVEADVSVSMRPRKRIWRIH
jgi:hypothetical protein